MVLTGLNVTCTRTQHKGIRAKAQNQVNVCI